MSKKVTRIAYSKHLNQAKYDRLQEQAQRLGRIRAARHRSLDTLHQGQIHIAFAD